MSRDSAEVTADAGPSLTKGEELQARYVHLSMAFLGAMQRNEMDKAFAASDELLAAFPGHPSAVAFQALVRERAASAGARGGAASAVKQRRREEGDNAAAAADEVSDADDEDDEEEETDDEEEEEDGEGNEGGATAKEAVVAPRPSVASNSSAAAVSAVPPSDYADEDDPFSKMTDDAVAKELEKLGVLTRAAAAHRVQSTSAK
jgi:hypothetical protein